MDMIEAGARGVGPAGSEGVDGLQPCVRHDYDEGQAKEPGGVTAISGSKPYQ